ncbi:hypothetical protein ACGFU4_36210 [Streptomyces sp. NPDC048511]|uniref:hypothetical protein n=1 Tax=Streptomyces sp. NPDC048511 TaxID=3365562 RepID=UPI0037198F9B
MSTNLDPREVKAPDPDIEPPATDEPPPPPAARPDRPHEPGARPMPLSRLLHP